MRTHPLSLTLAAALLAFTTPARPQEHSHDGMGKIGTVSFLTSCNSRAQPQFNRAVALLHSFEFRAAIEGFEATLKADPSCALAEWGIALSRWSNPFAAGVRPPAVLQQGLAAVDRAKTIGPKTDRERGYI